MGKVLPLNQDSPSDPLDTPASIQQKQVSGRYFYARVQYIALQFDQSRPNPSIFHIYCVTHYSRSHHFDLNRLRNKLNSEDRISTMRYLNRSVWILWYAFYKSVQFSKCSQSDICINDGVDNILFFIGDFLLLV